MSEAEERRDEGLDRVTINNRRWLSLMRLRARLLSHTQGRVTVQDIREYCDRADFHPRHPNAYGAIFRGKDWELIGYTKNSTPSAHARRIGVWRYIGHLEGATND